MIVLLVGGGGRENALAERLAASPLLTALHACPGNPGIAGHAKCHAVAVDDLEGILELASRLSAELVVVGPEAPLVAGLADRLRQAGILVIGPDAAAAQLEGSKVFARDFCQRHDIPQPGFCQATNLDEAEVAIRRFCASGEGCVIKADGLAAGKGVIIADSADEALAAAASILGDAATPGAFGAAGASIVVEERISGIEASLFALCDGVNAINFGTAQDYKRAHDGDKGPNTGGMGAVSPAPAMTEQLEAKAWQRIVLPVLAGMAAEGKPYKGFLYVGLMLTAKGPQVIEFNCRFGDPEAEVVLPRLQSDLLTALVTAAEGGLSNLSLRWHSAGSGKAVAVTVIMANQGYPGAYQAGSRIDGVVKIEAEPAVHLYHAGTSLDAEGRLVASGGRVLAITGLGPDQEAARARAYAAVAEIDWPQGFFRRDIASGDISKANS